MRSRQLLAVTILLSAAAACAPAGQVAAQGGGTAVPTSETVRISQPPATAWVGFGAEVLDEGRMVITQVVAGSPAADAGFQAGDTLMAVDGRDALEHRPNFRRLTPGQRYRIVVRRGTGTLELVLVPGPPRPAPARP